MLEQLLNEIKKGGALSVDALAKKLDTTPAMVRVMLEHLLREQRLRTFNFCGSSCSACSINDDCVTQGVNSQQLLYTLTNIEKK